jgi:hypothetical protein
MVVAALVSLLQTRVFEASVVFLLEESKIPDDSVASQINQGYSIPTGRPTRG